MNQRSLKYAFALASALTLAGSALAQTAPAPKAAPATDEETIILTPFEVTSEKDTGYAANSTLAGTRIRTDLKDVGSAITVVTKEFMKDIGATDGATLLQYTPNAEVAGTRGTYAGLGNGTSVDETASLRAPSGAQRVRGLAAGDNARDFYISDIPWDAFNIDRVDIQRGPNSILFGLGSPAGMFNESTRNAEYRNTGSADLRVGSYGSTRVALDYNASLIKNVLAVRFDVLNSKQLYQQKPAYQDDKRYYATLRFDPKLFNNRDWRTSIKVKFENGEISANRPRTVPPADSITPWFDSVANNGMGKLAVNSAYDIGAQPTTYSPWLTSDAIANQQQPIWFLDGNTGSLLQASAGYINTGARNPDGTLRGSSQNLIGQKYASQFFGLSNYASYATNAKLANYASGQYRQRTLQDPTVFDFYNNLIDGPNKKEWERWNAANINISQTAFGDRLGLDLTYDSQRYTRGGQALLGNPTLNIDVLKNLQDLSANPNFGRPYITGGSGSGNSYTSDRQYLRASLFAELRASDLVSNKFLVKLLGKHRFNGVFGEETYKTETRNWTMYANSLDWAKYWSRTDGTGLAISDRAPVGIVYLGSSLKDAATASGANIPRIQSPLTYQNTSLYLFDSTWTATGVAYNAPWTVPSNLATMFAGSTTNPTDPLQNPITQASNPANYKGWGKNFNATVISNNDGTNLDLLSAAQRAVRSTKSYASSWQGFLWDGAIVPTLGWRYDSVVSRGVTGLQNAANNYIVNLSEGGAKDYSLPTGPVTDKVNHPNQTYGVAKAHSTSGGLVVHINKLLPKDPLPFNVSVSYNESSNFQVTDLRRDLYGNTIANPSGVTRDYGLQLSTKDDKVSFRVVKYTTIVKGGSTSLNPSGLGNVVQQGLRFRNVFLYKLSNYPWSSREQPQDRNNWQTAYVDNTTGRPVAQGTVTTAPANSTLQTQAQADAMRDATITAWNNIQKYLQDKGYFAAWGYTPTTASALTTRAAYEAAKTSPTALDPATQFAPDTSTVTNYIAVTPQGFSVTADTRSTGYEYELTANPLKNWRISINAAQQQAVRTNVGGAVLDEFVAYMDQQMAGTAGDMRQFSGGYVAGNEVRMNWANWRGQYTLMKLQEGTAVSELRKWRYNIVTNYTFNKGVLKGLGVGGSYRWQDKVVIGYPLINSGTFDLSSPVYGPSEDAIDLWTSYERKLTKKINWKIQLNVRNAFAKDSLIPISVQPDGKTIASARIAPNQEWFVSNTFSF